MMLLQANEIDIFFCKKAGAWVKNVAGVEGGCEVAPAERWVCNRRYTRDLSRGAAAPQRFQNAPVTSLPVEPLSQQHCTHAVGNFQTILVFFLSNIAFGRL
jgi:hypothetical protein